MKASRLGLLGQPINAELRIATASTLKTNTTIKRALQVPSGRRACILRKQIASGNRLRSHHLLVFATNSSSAKPAKAVVAQ